jgi:L-cysteine S-thiosulfotransferase
MALTRSGAQPRQTMKRLLPIAIALAATTAFAQEATYKVEGDGIPKPLTSAPGVAARGKTLIAAKGAANCLECHTIKKDKLNGGTKGPALDGVGAVLTPAQLRLTVVDFARVNPKVTMPSFHKSASILSVGDGKPTLSAQEVEDVVAYLSTLR